MSLQYRQLERNFDVLEKFNIIKRRYNTSAVGDRKIGNSLHIDLTPINLLTKANDLEETEDNMTFFGEFECIEEKTSEHHWLTRCAWFKHLANTDRSIKQPIIQVILKPNCLNSQALENLEKDDLIVFKARVSRRITNEGKEVILLKDIHNIRPRDEYYNNYREQQ